LKLSLTFDVGTGARSKIILFMAQIFRSDPL